MTQPIAVFDLDGTLVHTAPDLVGSLNHALGVHGYEPVPYSELLLYAGTGGRGMLKHYAAFKDIVFPEPEMLAIIDTFLAHYQAGFPGQSVVYGGAIELVSALRAAGFKTAICTNKPQYLADELLVKLDIARHFDAICGADYFAFRKPDPRHLTGTIALALGVPERAIMFGDSQTDFDTANAANIPVIGVTFGYSAVPISNFKLTRTISHFEELSVEAIASIIGG